MICGNSDRLCEVVIW